MFNWINIDFLALLLCIIVSKNIVSLFCLSCVFMVVQTKKKIPRCFMSTNLFACVLAKLSLKPEDKKQLFCMIIDTCSKFMKSI